VFPKGQEEFSRNPVQFACHFDTVFHPLIGRDDQIISANTLANDLFILIIFFYNLEERAKRNHSPMLTRIILMYDSLRQLLRKYVPKAINGNYQGVIYMNIEKRYPVLVMALMVSALFLVSACTQPGTGSGTSSGTSSLTTLQVLQNSENAMKQLKSSHVELQSTSNYQTTGTSTSSSSTLLPPNGTANITASGDEALPDTEQLQLTVNQSTKLAQIVQGNDIYIQNAQGKWYVLNKNNFSGLVGNPLSGVNFDQNSLLGLVEHANITDHGDENLNGQSLRHISAALDKTAVVQLLNANPQIANQFGQQNVNDLVNKMKSFQSTLDVWIDESQFYVHQAQFKLNLTADTSGVGGSGQSSTTGNLNTTVDLSKFNETVTITPPSNATPTNNPKVIFANS
jgi:hypothetical protein